MSFEIISVVIAAVATLVAVTSAWVAIFKKRHFSLQISEEAAPEPRRGLIILIGPKEGAAIFAIEYHLPALQYCWLLGSEESLQTANSIITQFKPKITFYYDHSIDPDQIQDTYNKVTKIVKIEAAKFGLKSADLIADITGGLKPMSAGTALACVNVRCDMQFMKAQRDASGVVIQGAKPQPIRVGMTVSSV